MRIGHGYDVHRFCDDRKLIIGGVQIDYQKGLLGHSDADVLLHTICDSLLGAAALGDIGAHFPDSDPKFKDIDSMILLENTALLLKQKGYKVINIDATIIAQEPKMSPHIHIMRKNISEAVGMDIDCVSVKATTEENLGFTGKKEGIACHCVCLIDQM
ncbi:MAG: 2-C-methyl-D-erythritol 2,4-cyclodiphosphate synthase [Clostridia bacterium]|nr:2-C-methyl-D-erythritol 2,4-cyclodiphosphate synthase [Clostridia bacterium]